MVILIMALLFSACSKAGAQTGGGKSITSADALKAYLDSQPTNSVDKPIKVKMSVNEQMIGNVVKVIQDAGKYVNLDLSGSPLTTIPREAFKDCKSLAVIIIPNGVTNIGWYAFVGTSLTAITIPNSVTSIEGRAFGGISLTAITIPDSVTSIGDGAFWGCTSLTSITIGNSVTSIENNVFSSCTSLTSIIIPNSVTNIGLSAFIKCENLTSVTFQGTIESDNLGDFFYPSFMGDLEAKYLKGGIGTYTTTAPVSDNSIWTKQ